MPPLGDQPWVNAPGPAFATHALYIVETAASTTQDPTTGLPVVSGTPAPTLMAPAPRVRIGGKLIPSPGGAMVRMGDARVSNLSKAAWPMSRLLGAQGFRIDSATGELYLLMKGTLKEAGPATWEFLLERASQPRP